MPNWNLKVETTCPSCNKVRLARGDVVRKAQKEGKELWCKPCRNQKRFSDKPHPKKGTGVINNPDLKRTRNSFYKAKRRCKLGSKHHPAYENVLNPKGKEESDEVLEKIKDKIKEELDIQV